jgi:hypothetical protein
LDGVVRCAELLVVANCFQVAHHAPGAAQRVADALQRLHQAGWSHAFVASLYIAATVVLGITLLAGSWLWVLGLAGVLLLIGVWLDQRVAVAFAVASARA